MKNKEITAKTKMNELIKDKPEAVGLLFEAGMGCVGCHMAQLETLEQGCMAHGMSKEEIDEIKSYIEEDNMELSDDIKIKIEESRKTPISKMKTQEEIEKKFL